MSAVRNIPIFTQEDLAGAGMIQNLHEAAGIKHDLHKAVAIWRALSEAQREDTKGAYQAWLEVRKAAPVASAFAPGEGVEAMRLRFSAAIEVALRPSDLRNAVTSNTPPGQEHIFDFADGIRMIVSRLKMKREMLHFSFSALAAPATGWGAVEVEREASERAFQFTGKIHAQIQFRSALGYHLFFATP